LANARAETFVRSVSAPLADDLREAIRVLFDMRWGGAEADLLAEDWQAYQRLCQSESEDFILNRTDYYAFFTYSLFCGEA
jgi:demethylmenaquinone methyltransferase/2-methoxy-6-polyprenyl-1,4-benzoquinol methylase